MHSRATHIREGGRKLSVQSGGSGAQKRVIFQLETPSSHKGGEFEGDEEESPEKYCSARRTPSKQTLYRGCVGGNTLSVPPVTGSMGFELQGQGKRRGLLIQCISTSR